ncbi:MAG: Brp/Blh family beta-carotene 15,15'-dioxygenase [Betaproteobacteria bacterium]|nr:Brp/Blh family beta-carotene 15,15'-dioxygenase [Betaproteobacteria bacterium]
MNKIEIQGLLFSVVAILVGLISPLLIPTDHSSLIVILAIVILFLGVPHGALDPVFAQKILFLKSFKDWLIFVLIYVVLSIIVVCIWWQLPLIFMSIFLLLSTIHFSRDLNEKINKFYRLIYGGSIIILPTVFHQSEIQNIFSSILNINSGIQITGFLKLMSLPWFTANLISIFLIFKRDWHIGLELFALTLLATLSPPLIAFTVYFCGMHSLRHILRTKIYSNLSYIKLGLLSVIPMTSLIVFVILSWKFLAILPDNNQLLRFIFVGLAALTVPHMLLIDRVKYQY